MIFEDARCIRTANVRGDAAATPATRASSCGFVHRHFGGGRTSVWRISLHHLRRDKRHEPG
jgi:hypothetical protein